jgi:hypothetical protein
MRGLGRTDGLLGWGPLRRALSGVETGLSDSSRDGKSWGEWSTYPRRASKCVSRSICVGTRPGQRSGNGAHLDDNAESRFPPHAQRTTQPQQRSLKQAQARDGLESGNGRGIHCAGRMVARVWRRPRPCWTPPESGSSMACAGTEGSWAGGRQSASASGRPLVSNLAEAQPLLHAETDPRRSDLRSKGR